MRRDLPTAIVLILLLSTVMVIHNTDKAQGVFSGLEISINGNSELSSSTYVSSGNGTSHNPYIITGLDLGSGSLKISNTTSHCWITNTIISSGDGYAIDIYNCDNIKMIGLYSDGRDAVIRADSSDSISLSSLTILNASNSHHGIQVLDIDDFNLANSFLSAASPNRPSHLYMNEGTTDKVIQNNTFNSFFVFTGILDPGDLLKGNYLYNSTLEIENASEGSRIVDNIFISPNLPGITLKTSLGYFIKSNYFQCSKGIYLVQSQMGIQGRSAIFNNTFESCDLGFSSKPNDNWARIYYVDIYDNYFGNCTDYAIYDSNYGIDNHIYRNIFYHNKGSNDTVSMPQVYQMFGGSQYTWANKWSWLGEGNFWSDHRVPDIDGDGIVDTPYRFANNGEDEFPYSNIDFDLTRPSIDILSPSGGDIHISYQRIRWDSSDLYGINNERLIVGSKEYDVTGQSSHSVFLERGTHTLRLNVTDGNGLTNEVSMNVTLDQTTNVVSILDPVNGDYINTPSYPVNWTIIPNFPVVEQVLTVNREDLRPSPDDRSYMVDLIEGYNTIKLSITDDHLLQREVELSVIRDTIQPQITFISPSHESILTNELVSLKWSVFDENPFSSIETRFDDGIWEDRKDINEINLLVSTGEHTFDVKAVDRAGNEKIETLKFLVGPDPNLMIISPENGLVTRLSKCEFSWEYYGTFNWSSAFIRVGNTTQFMDIGGAHTFDLDLIRSTRASDEGPYHITLKLEDEHGNHIQKWVTVIRDNTPPKVVFNFPDDFPYSNRERVDISWLGLDENGILEYWIKIDDGTWELIGNSTEHPIDLEEKVYSVHVRAIDMAGNIGEYSTSFTIDRTDPILRITGPDEGAIIEFGEVTFKWELSDISGLSYVNLSVDGLPDLDVTDVFSLTRSIIEEGHHYVRIRAVDLCGNIAVKELGFYVDLSEPEVEWSVEYPSMINETELNLSWNAFDIVGIDTITLKINGEEKDHSSNSFVTDLEDGEYEIILEVVDLSGKVTKICMDLIVDSYAPFIDILAERCSVVDGIAEVIWNIEESGSGLKDGSVMVSVDGGIPQTSPLMDRYVTGRLGPGDHIVTIHAQDNAGNQIQESFSFTVEEKQQQSSDSGGSGWIIIFIIIAVLLIAGIAVAVVLVMNQKKKDQEKKPASGTPGRLTMAIPAPRTSGSDLIAGMKAAPSLPPKKAQESSVGNGYIRPDKDNSQEARPRTISNGHNNREVETRVDRTEDDQKDTS